MFRPDEKKLEAFRSSLSQFQDLMRQGGDEILTLDRIARLIDQKATSLLTYLAIILAGVSIMFVGGSNNDGYGWAFTIAFTILFGIIFTAAFLCLSVTSIVTGSRVFNGRTTEEVLEHMTIVIAARESHFRLSYRLTVVSSGLFAVLVFFRLFAPLLR